MPTVKYNSHGSSLLNREAPHPQWTEIITEIHNYPKCREQLILVYLSQIDTPCISKVQKRG